MKVSLITVTYNSATTLATTIQSIADQEYSDIELIVVDGGSTDGTLEVINKYGDFIRKWISEPDTGLYDAINKGINMASGEVVGIIHSDDFYHRKDAIGKVVESFSQSKCQCVFADVRFVRADNLEKTVRYYSSKSFNLGSFSWGFMPAHPTFFTYRENFKRYGLYRTDYQIAADFELVVRFLYKHKLSFHYIPIDLLKMRIGGLSTRSLKSTWIINQEDLRACRENGLKTNYLRLYSRYLRKLMEYFPDLFC